MRSLIRLIVQSGSVYLGFQTDKSGIVSKLSSFVTRQESLRRSIIAIVTASFVSKRYCGSLVISGVHNYLIFQANKAYPDRSRWIRWNKCLTFTIPYQRRLMTLILLLNPSTNPLVCLSRK